MASEKKGITVRFEDDEMERIALLAKRYNVNPTTIIRWAIIALYDYVEANGGKITLPLDFSKIYESLESAAPRESVKYPSQRNLRAVPPARLNEEPKSRPAK